MFNPANAPCHGIDPGQNTAIDLQNEADGARLTASLGAAHRDGDVASWGRAMGIVSWIVLGLIAGAIAKLLMPGDDPGGFFVTILIGIVGAIVGGFIATAFGLATVSGLNLPSVVIAICGSLILLIAYRMIRRR
jgi:uncharacterized membrane protein YeaQ/YmgE (transglycosylase-associated protein family)